MRITSAIPVLRVSNYETAREFWRDRLGFAVVEEGGDPARFGIFVRDGQRVFLDGWRGPEPQAYEGWRVYLHTDDLDGVAAGLSAAGVAFVKAPYLTVYGMRELEITDPDGNRLCFGQDAG